MSCEHERTRRDIYSHGPHGEVVAEIIRCLDCLNWWNTFGGSYMSVETSPTPVNESTGRSGARPGVISESESAAREQSRSTAGENPASVDQGEMLSEEDFYWKHESPEALRAKLQAAETRCEMLRAENGSIIANAGDEINKLKAELAEAQWLAAELKTERDVWVRRYHDGFGPLDKVTAERDELVKWGRAAYLEFVAALQSQRELAVVASRDKDTPRRMLAQVVAEHLDQFAARAPASIREQAPKLSEEARAARAPRPPEELVGALQDRVHPTSGRLLASKPLPLELRLPFCGECNDYGYLIDTSGSVPCPTCQAPEKK